MKLYPCVAKCEYGCQYEQDELKDAMPVSDCPFKESV